MPPSVEFKILFFFRKYFLVFNLVLVLLLSSHAKCALSDPGHVPVPESRIDFSDTSSLQNREDDWTICQVLEKKAENEF